LVPPSSRSSRGALIPVCLRPLTAYNFTRGPKTPGALTPYEHICKDWTEESDRFDLNPVHQIPGLKNQPALSYARVARIWRTMETV